eukprot:Sdes_comp20737_c0_seq1m16587
MSSVHYKFKSSRDYDTITFDGPSISLVELKEAIILQKKLGKAGDLDLQVINAQTNEEYVNEKDMVPKNTSVIVKRTPATRTGNFGEKYSANASNGMGRAPSGYARPAAPFPPVKSAPPVPSFAQASGEPLSEDDRMKQILSQSGEEWNTAQIHALQKKRNFQAAPTFRVDPNKKPPSNYICYKCGKPGHYIHNCNVGGDNNKYHLARMKRPTGIPKSFLKTVAIAGSEQPAEGTVLLADGSFAVVSTIENAFEKAVKVAKHDIAKKDIPPDLLCGMCKTLFKDAVVIPCCSASFCDECIRSYLLKDDGFQCPKCLAQNVSPAKLVPNVPLRKLVKNFLIQGEDHPLSPEEKSLNDPILSNPEEFQAGPTAVEKPAATPATSSNAPVIQNITPITSYPVISESIPASHPPSMLPPHPANMIPPQMILHRPPPGMIPLIPPGSRPGPFYPPAPHPHMHGMPYPPPPTHMLHPFIPPNDIYHPPPLPHHPVFPANSRNSESEYSRSRDSSSRYPRSRSPSYSPTRSISSPPRSPSASSRVPEGSSVNGFRDSDSFQDRRYRSDDRYSRSNHPESDQANSKENSKRSPEYHRNDSDYRRDFSRNNYSTNRSTDHSETRYRSERGRDSRSDYSTRDRDRINRNDERSSSDSSRLDRSRNEVYARDRDRFDQPKNDSSSARDRGNSTLQRDRLIDPKADSYVPSRDGADHHRDRERSFNRDSTSSSASYRDRPREEPPSDRDRYRSNYGSSGRDRDSSTSDRGKFEATRDHHGSSSRGRTGRDRDEVGTDRDRRERSRADYSFARNSTTRDREPSASDRDRSEPSRSDYSSSSKDRSVREREESSQNRDRPERSRSDASLSNKSRSTLVSERDSTEGPKSASLKAESSQEKMSLIEIIHLPENPPQSVKVAQQTLSGSDLRAPKAAILPGRTFPGGLRLVTAKNRLDKGRVKAAATQEGRELKKPKDLRKCRIKERLEEIRNPKIFVRL